MAPLYLCRLWLQWVHLSFSTETTMPTDIGQHRKEKNNIVRLVVVRGESVRDHGKEILMLKVK